LNPGVLVTILCRWQGEKEDDNEEEEDRLMINKNVKLIHVYRVRPLGSL